MTDIDGHESSTSASATPAPWPGIRPGPCGCRPRRYAVVGGATTMLPTHGAAGWRRPEGRFGPTPGATRSPHRCQSVGDPDGPRNSPGGPRSSCSTTATTAAWTKSPSCWDGRARSPGRATSGARGPSDTTRIVEFNDLDALGTELAAGDVAAVLMEPALTNIGIVLPEPGYRRVREADAQPARCCQRRDPHVPPGPAAARAWDWTRTSSRRQVDRGGIPAGAFGLAADLAEARTPHDDSATSRRRRRDARGQRLSTAAMRATLERVLTPSRSAR